MFASYTKLAHTRVAVSQSLHARPTFPMQVIKLLNQRPLYFHRIPQGISMASHSLLTLARSVV